MCNRRPTAACGPNAVAGGLLPQMARVAASGVARRDREQLRRIPSGMLTCRPLARSAAMAAAAALAGCGTSNSASTVETVTVTQPQRTAATQSAPISTQPQSAPHGAATNSSPQTRTAPAPAFTGGASGSGSPSAARAAAIAKLRGLGFTPTDASSYHADQTLRVLIGARTGSADQRTQRAFFFNGARYLGTDTADTSASLRVVAQSDTEVTLGYGIYRPGNPLCCPQGGTRDVRFQLDMGRLSPVDPLPDAAQRQ